MATEVIRNLRLGIFVLVGTALLILSLYFIGNTKNLFGANFTISAEFKNVNGLMPGNNVRFAGIDVGTVASINIASDTSVKVVMIIEEKARKHIKKNALASIGTDGLMGNKLVNINNRLDVLAQSIEEGDVLQTLRPIETDEMLRTLNATNDNVQIISNNLKNITQKINNSNSLWSLLMDTVIAENLKSAVVSIKQSGQRTAIITGDLSALVSDAKGGKGTIGALLTDTALSGKLSQAVVSIQFVGKEMAIITGDLKNITEKINAGKGSVGTLLMDTTFVHNLNQSMAKIDAGSASFTEVMEGLKHSIFLRRYFKKQQKKKEVAK